MKKNKKKALALILAIIMGTSGLTACSNTNKSDFEENTTLETVFTTESTTVSITESTTIDTQIVKEDILTEYLTYFDFQNIKYNHEEYYITEEDVKKAIEVSKTIQECDFLYDGNYYDLYEKIVSNTKNYVKSSEYKDPFSEETSLYRGTEDQIMFSTALYDVLYDWHCKKAGNINEDACRAQDLKVVIGKENNEDLLGLYNSQENLIIIYLENIKKNVKNSEKSLESTLKNTIWHEYNHMRQAPCLCRLKKGQTYTFEKGDYIGGIGASLKESSAESYIFNNKSIEPFEKDEDTFDYTYYDERRQEAELMFLNIFQENSDIKDYYRAIFDSDLQAFHRYFGVENEKDILNLYKIIYSIDGLNGSNSLPYNICKKDKLSSNEITRTIGKSYKANLFNYILKNMVEYSVKNTDFTLEQNLVMFNFVKNFITDEIYTLTEEKDENGFYKHIYDKKLVESITKSEEKYVEFLSNHYIVSIDYIRNLKSVDDIIYNLSEYLYNNDYRYYTDDVRILLERFPDLEKIGFAMAFIPPINYDNFMEENGISYNKTTAKY